MIRKALALAVALTCLSLPDNATAQSRYFSRDQSGISLAAGILSPSSNLGLAGEIGFTVRGRVDLAAGYATRDWTPGHEMMADGPRISATIALLRPSESFRGGLELVGRYAKLTPQQEEPVSPGQVASEKRIDIGGVIYFRLPTLAWLEVVPALGIFRGKEESTWYSQYLGPRESQKVGTFVTGELGLHIGSRVVLVPAFNNAESEAWSLSLRWLIRTGG